jgi:hypothetical protein
MPPGILAIGELVSTMKKTVGILESTMECLGDQTTKIAELSPAIEAAAQVSSLYYCLFVCNIIIGACAIV